jgi:glycosyltransferase involved in cell wall biosynthesis
MSPRLKGLIDYRAAMERFPLVSVLIPLFNHEQFIGECLESVLESGYPRIEVIVLDDGSSDASYEMASQWRRSHPDAFESFHLSRQNHSGHPSTLNRLVCRASGRYVAPLASDDLLLPGGLETRIESLNAHTEWLAVFGDCIVVDAHGRIVAKSGLEYSPNRNRLLRANKAALSLASLINWELILRWSIPGPVLLVRREAYDLHNGVGPYDETMVTGDRDFYLRLLSQNAIGFVDQVVAAYRVHDDNSIFRQSFRPALARTISEAERKNATGFEGLQRTALRLIALKSANYAEWLEQPTPVRFVAAVIFRALFEFACILHDLRTVAVEKTH